MEDLAVCTNVYHVLDEFRLQMSAGHGLMSLQNYQSIQQASVAADGCMSRGGAPSPCFGF